MRLLPIGAIFLAAGLAGCQFNGGANVSSARPDIPSYPSLADTFDKSLRLAVYGTNAEERNLMCGQLKSCGYAVDVRSVGALVGQVVQPDLVVFILSCDIEGCGFVSGGYCFACHMRVLVRPAMRTPCDAEPAVPAGETFDVWSSASVKSPSYRNENGALVMEPDAEGRRNLLAKACANLMNVEGFRRALERK